MYKNAAVEIKSLPRNSRRTKAAQAVKQAENVLLEHDRVMRNAGTVKTILRKG